MKDLPSAYVAIVFWIALTVGAGCGYRYYAGALKPADESQQVEPVRISDDGTITFVRERLEVSVRPVSDEELNRQFPTYSKAGAKSVNPYTFGDWKDRDFGETPPRFTVFKLRVKNYTYPKIWLDTSKMRIVSDNGRTYSTLTLPQLIGYYRTYVTGYSGNAYHAYEQRMDILKRTLFPNDVLFSGQKQEGFVVFPKLHPDVDRITVQIRDLVLRFDFRNEPVEKINIEYVFRRDIGRQYVDGTIELKKTP